MISKRKALKVALAAGVVTTFSGVVPGLQQVLAAPPLRVRRCVNTMEPDDPDLSTYRDFVRILQSRPEQQRVSWVGFANQHGTAQAFKYCPHRDWYFLPWHRGFVDMYERAAAALTGNPQFAMPYWDWTLLRQLPAAFTDPTFQGRPNPLYVPNRNALTGPYALTDDLVGPDVIRKIYSEISYEAFGTTRNPQQDNLDPSWVPKGGGLQGTLEYTPHNSVHNNIGGFMRQTNSPRDPIFMMHHGNIDRIWASWNALGRSNSTDPLWLDMLFTNNYIDANGSFYSRKVRDLLRTEALGYTYDVLPKAENRPVDQVRLANFSALFNPAVRTTTPLRLKKSGMQAAVAATSVGVPFQVPPQDLALLRAPASAPNEAAPREVVALIKDVRVADNVRAIRVFVNLPVVSPDIPTTDPHFVATLSFLRHDHGHGGHGEDEGAGRPSFIVNLTEALRKLAQQPQGLQGNEVTVQLVALPAVGTSAAEVGTVVPASVEIAFV